MSSDLTLRNHLLNDNWVEIIEMTSVEDWKVFRLVNKTAIYHVEIAAASLLKLLNCQVTENDENELTPISSRRILALNNLMNLWGPIQLEQSERQHKFTPREAVIHYKDFAASNSIFNKNLVKIINYFDRDSTDIASDSSICNLFISKVTRDINKKESSSSEVSSFFFYQLRQGKTPFEAFISFILPAHRHFTSASWDQIKNSKTHMVALIIFNFSDIWFENHPALDDLRTINGTLSFQRALETNNERVLKTFLKEPLDIDLQNSMMYTLNNYNFKTFKLLHDHYLEFENNYSDLDILKIISPENREEPSLFFIDYILRYKFNPNGTSPINEGGETALIQLIKDHEYELAKILIENGAEIEEKGSLTTPIWEALFAENLELIKLLLGKGANINRFLPWLFKMSFLNEGLTIFKGNEAREFLDVILPEISFFTPFSTLFFNLLCLRFNYSLVLLTEAIYKKIVVKISLIANSIF